jgi:hypothetical protein
LPASGVSVGADYASVVGDDQGIFVLPQTTAGTDFSNKEELESTTEFGLEIAYTINGVPAPGNAFVQFGDLNDIAGTGVTFETGRQYVLNLSFGSGSGTGGGGGGSGTDPDISIGAKISFSTLVDDFDGPIDAGLPPPPPFTPASVIWSQSNIYFDADSDGDSDDATGVLTFSETDDYNFYQGVSFKWGSLVGVSAYNGSKSFQESYLFIPDLSTGVYHKVLVSELAAYSGGVQAVNDFRAALVSDWGIEWGVSSYNDLWAAIPFVKWNTGSSTDDVISYAPAQVNGRTARDDDALTRASDASDVLYSSYRGDICRFLYAKRAVSGLTSDLNWRMPTSHEFSSNYGYNNPNDADNPDPAVEVGPHYTTKWNNTDNSSSASFTSGSAENGTAVMDQTGNHYYTLVTWIKSGDSPSFPASGGRGFDNGSLNGVGTYGIYWSSSANTGNAYDLYFNYFSVGPRNGDSDRSNGQSVRCVRL